MSVITNYGDKTVLKGVTISQKGEITVNSEQMFFNLRVRVHSVSKSYITVQCPNDQHFKMFVKEFQDKVQNVMGALDVTPLIYVHGDDILMKLYYSKESTVLFNANNDEIDLDVSSLSKSNELLAIVHCPMATMHSDGIVTMPLSIYQFKIKRMTNCMIVEPPIEAEHSKKHSKRSDTKYTNDTKYDSDETESSDESLDDKYRSVRL